LQQDVTPAQLLEQSGKLQCFLRLMLELQQTGHRALVFSQSRKMLDMVSHVMKANNLRYITTSMEKYYWSSACSAPRIVYAHTTLRLCRHTRLDGTVKDEFERQQLVEQYNNDDNIFCMLLTTQVRVQSGRRL